MNNIHGKNKDIYLSEENRCRTWSIREQPNPERPLLHSIRSCSPAIDSAHFFHWHWINSKNCSLWNKVGLVRTFRIQSQHSRDFQVSSMPKTPSILRTLERTDNLSAQNHSTPPQSYFKNDFKESVLTHIHKQYHLCERWNAANPSTGDSQTRPQQTYMAGGVKRTPATQTCGQQSRR